MSRYKKDKLIILKKTPYQDENLIVNAFGYELGQISFKVRNSNKITSFKKANLNELNIIEAKLYLSSKYYSLTESKVLNYFNDKLDFKSLIYKDLLCDFLSKNLQDTDHQSFNLVEFINSQKTINFKLYIIFICKFLENHGLISDHEQLPKTLRYYLNSTIQNCLKLQLDKIDSQKSFELLQKILENHLDYKIPKKLVQILEAVNKLN